MLRDYQRSFVRKDNAFGPLCLFICFQSSENADVGLNEFVVAIKAAVEPDLEECVLDLYRTMPHSLIQGVVRDAA